MYKEHITMKPKYQKWLTKGPNSLSFMVLMTSIKNIKKITRKYLLNKEILPSHLPWKANIKIKYQRQSWGLWLQLDRKIQLVGGEEWLLGTKIPTYMAALIQTLIINFVCQVPTNPWGQEPSIMERTAILFSLSETKFIWSNYNKVLFAKIALKSHHR